MATKLTKTHAALKVLSEGIDQMTLYKYGLDRDLSSVRHFKGAENFSEVYFKTKEGEVRTAYKEKMDALIEKMRNAAHVLDENEELKSIKLDPSDANLQNAMNIIRATGKGMDPEDQIALIDKFKGNPPALRVIGSLMKQNGMYFSDYAVKLTTEVSPRAFDDLFSAIAKYEYNGEWEEGQLHWTKHEFSDAGNRLGLNLIENPYEYALKEMGKSNTTSEEAQKLIAEAIESVSDLDSDGLYHDVGERMDIANKLLENVMSADAES